MAKLALFTLFALLSTPQLSSALQVTPNSPCSSACRDSLDLDASDPNSSNTRNPDITCPDAGYSSPAGAKFKTCMTCLQTSTFSQGSESDTMWFLYNLRYTAAYCLFAFPNATGVGTSPCSTSKACGPLQDSLQHGILNPGNMTAYSYCSAGGGAAMDSANYEHCIPCVSAEGRTGYLANYFVALEAGCQQKPAPGVLLGLNDTIFAATQITIVDPTTLKATESSKPGLGTPVIAGIVGAAVAVLLIAAGVTFVCLRKRKNQRTRARASAEADFYTRFNTRHHSSMSFQCQTHMISPRLWPGAAPEDGLATPETTSAPDLQTHRSSIYKPHDPDYPYQSPLDAHPPQVPTKPAAAAALHITTTVPPQAYTSPTSADRTYYHADYFKSPLSAESARSTSALLPSIKPYVPAEHGIHAASPPSISLTSPTTTVNPSPGTGMTPLLTSGAWPLLPEQKQQPQKGQGRRSVISLGNVHSDSFPPPPPPPPIKTTLSSGWGKKSPRVQGSPVESWEIQTAFAAPPKR